MSSSLDLLVPTLQRVQCDLLRERDVVLHMLRLDLIHPRIHGNKWYKLKYNVERVLEQNIATVLSFGGAYSNHLAALAATGRQFGFRTIGLVRGELRQPLNPLLAFAREQGMRLESVSRSDYRRKTDAGYIAQLHQQFGEFYLLPEGGSNRLAVRGCAEIAQHLHWQSRSRRRYVALACGTGTTMAGLIQGIAASGQLAGTEPLPTVLGVAVLNAPGYLGAEVRRWLASGNAAPTGSVPWQMLEEYHGGGYAKNPPALQTLLQEFATYSTIPLEPVYTGKLLYALLDQIRLGHIAPGSEVIALHTGGIQP